MARTSRRRSSGRSRRSSSRKQSSGSKYSRKAGQVVRTEMHHLRSGKHKVKNRKQAIAIGLSKARQKGEMARKSHASSSAGLARESGRRETESAETPSVDRIFQSAVTSQTSSNGASNQAGRYPLDNLSYDLITIVHEKSKALEAYDRYLQDAEEEPEIRRALEQIQIQDRQSIEMLRRHLGRVLSQQGQRAA